MFAWRGANVTQQTLQIGSECGNGAKKRSIPAALDSARAARHKRLCKAASQGAEYRGPGSTPIKLPRPSSFYISHWLEPGTESGWHGREPP